MAQMEHVVWEDPPPYNRRGREGAGYTIGAQTDVSHLVRQLISYPGRWALVHVGGGEGTTARATKFRDAGCEVRTTRPAGSQRRLYARYLGE